MILVLTVAPKRVIRGRDDYNTHQNLAAHFDTRPQILSSVIGGHTQRSKPLTTPGNTRKMGFAFLCDRVVDREQSLKKQPCLNGEFCLRLGGRVPGLDVYPSKGVRHGDSLT